MKTLKMLYNNKKGEIFAACLLALFLSLYCSRCDVNAEETTAGVMYERVTHDGAVEERQVRQITTKIFTYNFTLNELDTYIDIQKEQIKQLENRIKKLQIMREAVFKEANK